MHYLDRECRHIIIRRLHSSYLQRALLGTLAVAMTLGCNDEPTGVPILSLSLVSTHDLSYTEPSGLTLDESGTALWTVVNQGIKKLDLQGNRIDSVGFNGDDLEGIAYDSRDETLWVVEEKLQQIVHLDMDGDVLSRQQLTLGGPKNSGLEGICIDDGGVVFALKEKDPALFLVVGSDQSVSSRELTFADDCSGIAYNSRADDFWVLSDQDQKLYKWSRSAGVVAEFSLPFQKAEGVAFDVVANLIYIVSDLENRLYVYKLGD